jgi:hypothetical protein
MALQAVVERSTAMTSGTERVVFPSMVGTVATTSADRQVTRAGEGG